MRWRKLVVSLLLVAVTIFDTVSLGSSVVHNEATETTIYAIDIGFAIYLLTMAIRSINQNDASQHSESVLHLTAMTTLATVFLGTTAILPTTPPVTTSVETASALQYIWHAKLCLYTIICVIMYTTPQGPRLQFPPERIYSEKTILAITNTDEENVCGISGKLSHIAFKSAVDKIVQALPLGIFYISRIRQRLSTSVTLLKPLKLGICPFFLQNCVHAIITLK